LALGFLILEPIGCGSILGIQDGVYDPEAGKHDATNGGSGEASVDGSMDSTVSEAMAEEGGEAGDVMGEAALCEGGLTACVVAAPEGGADAGVDAESGAGDDAGDDGGMDAGATTPAVGTVLCVDLTSDLANCGGCGVTCAVKHNAPTCTAGKCGVGTCDTNYADCNGMASDGCESNTQSDARNCGACGMACQNGYVCVAGACQFGCPGTQTKCYLDADGGLTDAAVDGGAPYCAELSTDAVNCGACGAACPVNNNAPSCSGGTCHVGTCNSGFGDCNGTVSDGCETNTNTNPAHCGTCGTTCTAANDTPICNGGSCAIGPCAAGYGDCNGLYSDGCEKNLNTDPVNCGTCGTSCATSCAIDVTGTTCSAGVCTITSCTSTYYDIDGVCSDGCECHATLPATCAAPTLVTLSGPGTSQNVSGNLVPTGTSSWIQVTFTGNTATTFHPHVAFMTNPGAEYVFDIETNCTGTGLGGCPDITGGATLALTNWEKYYQAGVDFVDAHFAAIPAVGTIYIHVYRASGAPVDCNSYTLTVSN
jgi:hypothetical protein